jgi:uncharacterized protein
LELDIPHLIFGASVFVLAGFVKGVIGLGLPAVAIGLLALFMTPAQAAALLVVPSLITNLWQMGFGPALRPLVRRLWPMLAGTCVGTALGAGLLTGAQPAYATNALGVALMIYGVLGLGSVRARVAPAWEPWLGPAVGVATGVVTAATGVFVMPAGPYLDAVGLDKDELVQALALSFTVSTVVLAVALARGGVLHGASAGLSLAALAPALGGMFLGQWARTRAHPDLFRRCFFVGLVGLGLSLALRGLI